MQEYEFWLLDLDGTILAADDGYITETIGAVGDLLGRRFTSAEARSIWYGRDGLRDDILRRHGVPPPAFWDAFHTIESPELRADATTLHPDAEVITDLDGPRGVVTHCQPYLLEPILDRLDIRDWFDTIVTGSDELGWKPDPAPMTRAMRQLAVNGDRGAMVGDSIADLGAARNVGITGIFIDREGLTTDVEADVVIDSLSELV